MSEQVWVQENDPEPGWWSALCCDNRCVYGLHAVLETESGAVARAAATRHRKYLATLPPEKTHKDECVKCGQSPTVVKQLQNLVQELEARLAQVERP